MADKRHKLSMLLDTYTKKVPLINDIQTVGRLTRVVGLTLEAIGCSASIGSRCKIVNPDGLEILAEVVGFDGSTVYLMPTSQMQGIVPSAKVYMLPSNSATLVGNNLLGRVLDGNSMPLDNKKLPADLVRYPLMPEPINPLLRYPINHPIDLGIQAINGMLTVGRGQRIGLFAGSGVGKSVLLGMMTRFTSAEIVVVGLIGERGREVKEFIENSLGPSGLERSVVVACPADNSPLLRMRGAWVATSIAEYFRDQGKHVLLLMDSLTRFAQAQREIGLAIGEPPTTKGYPPSVYSKLTQLVERGGNAQQGGGSITAIYTVLAEGDDQQDPIVDAARAILDGHIVLSRALADSGHFPAIDIEGSISRVMPNITTPQHQQAIRDFRSLYTKFQQNKDLIAVGAYVPGYDAELDVAVKCINRLKNFLQQDTDQNILLESTVLELQEMMQEIRNATHEKVQANAKTVSHSASQGGTRINTVGRNAT